MLQQESYDELIARFNKGDQTALNCLFHQYYRPLCLFAERLIRDRMAAEDIVEDTFIKLWQRHPGFKSMQNIKAFLYISTRNASLNLIKQLQRDETSKKEMTFRVSANEDCILTELIRSEVLHEIMTAVNALPLQCRKIFIMGFIEGQKNHEIAALLQISVHTVKNQKVRAQQLLKIKLQNKTVPA